MEIKHLAAGFVLLVVVYWIIWSIYTLFFHPLAKYPGPRLAAISELWYARSWVSGFFVTDIHELHLRHGPVVRIAPNELSFGTVQAAKDTYGPATKGKKLFLKSDMFYDIGDLPANIAFELDPEKHAVRRKLLLPGFRGQSLALQERIVHEHVDLMLEKLSYWGKQSPDGTVDMSHVYEWLTFDIIGQLVFGESFSAIAQGRSHQWVSSLLSSLYNDSVFALRKRTPALRAVLAVMPYISTTAAKNVEGGKRHMDLSLEHVRKRIGREDMDTPDIFQHIIQKGGLTEVEMLSEAMILIAAGAETTATMLVASMWYLLTNPQTLSKLQHEVRSTFSSQSSITDDSTAKLRYLNAVIEETMRIFAPVPEGLPRKSPGAIVDGNYIPAGVYVSAQTWHINRDPENAPDPERFEPERWIDSGFSATKTALTEEEGEENAAIDSADDGQDAGKGNKKKPFTAPFSQGPRACLGINLAYLEMRITIAKLIYKYDWAFPEGYLESGADWPAGCRLMQLWSVPGLNIKFTRA